MSRRVPVLPQPVLDNWKERRTMKTEVSLCRLVLIKQPLLLTYCKRLFSILKFNHSKSSNSWWKIWERERERECGSESENAVKEKNSSRLRNLPGSKRSFEIMMTADWPSSDISKRAAGLIDIPETMIGIVDSSPKESVSVNWKKSRSIISLPELRRQIRTSSGSEVPVSRHTFDESHWQLKDRKEKVDVRTYNKRILHYVHQKWMYSHLQWWDRTDRNQERYGCGRCGYKIV